MIFYKVKFPNIYLNRLLSFQIRIWNSFYGLNIRFVPGRQLGSFSDDERASPLPGHLSKGIACFRTLYSGTVTNYRHAQNQQWCWEKPQKCKSFFSNTKHSSWHDARLGERDALPILRLQFIRISTRPGASSAVSFTTQYDRCGGLGYRHFLHPATSHRACQGTKPQSRYNSRSKPS